MIERLGAQLRGAFESLRKAGVGTQELAVIAAALVVAVSAFAYAVSTRGTAPAGAGEFDRAERAAIREVVRQYILENPEIIPEAVNRLQQREVTKLLDSNRDEIETPFAGAWAGAKDGDVVLVEFFDYNCPYCRLSHADVQRLLKEDDDLKVVFRDFPVLGPASEEAAMASLSAAKQNRFLRYYNSSFEAPGRPNRERTIRMIRAAGLNEGQTAADLNSTALKNELRKNLELGRALGLTGTPTYIVGNRILSGAVGYDTLKQAIDEARRRER